MIAAAGSYFFARGATTQANGGGGFFAVQGSGIVVEGASADEDPAFSPARTPLADRPSHIGP